MFNLRSSLFAVITMAASSAVHAGDPLPATKSETALVKLEILRDGNIVGTPNFVMQVGTTTVVTVAKPDGYSVKVSLGDEPRFAGGRKLDMAVSVTENGQLVTIGRPSISLPLNQPGRVSFPYGRGKMLEIRAVIQSTSGQAS